MTTALIALGANLGDRNGAIDAAVTTLGRLEHTLELATSTLIETDPVGHAGQPKFLNGVTAIATALPPEQLLAALLAIERAHGRERSFQNAPRTLDLDLLFYGQEHINQPGLVVPHPKWQERMFVLVPLGEILAAPPLAGESEWNQLRSDVARLLIDHHLRSKAR